MITNKIQVYLLFFAAIIFAVGLIVGLISVDFDLIIKSLFVLLLLLQLEYIIKKGYNYV